MRDEGARAQLAVAHSRRPEDERYWHTSMMSLKLILVLLLERALLCQVQLKEHPESQQSYHQLLRK